MSDLPSSVLHCLAATAVAAAAMFVVPAAHAQPMVPDATGQSTSTTDFSKSAAVGDKVPYQKSVSSTCGTATCIIPLAKIPGKRRLEVRNMSCFSVMETNTGFNWFVMRNDRAPGGVFVDYMVPTKTAYVSGANYSYWSLNTEMLSFAAAGDTLSIRASGNGKLVSLQCKVSGELVYLG